jgi:hypothetical protein
MELNSFIVVGHINKTGLTPPVFIEMPVTIQESGGFFSFYHYMWSYGNISPNNILNQYGI